MTDVWEDICDFHRNFNLPLPMKAMFPADNAIMEFRLKFLKEELAEFEDAVKKQDLVKAFDALIDLTYVAVGTARFMNLPFPQGWEIVQNANMRKRRATHSRHSKRGSIYDVIKPEGWKSPDHALEMLLKAEDDPYITVNIKLEH